MTEYPAAAVDEHNGQFIAEYRANGGKVSGPQYQGVDLLLLHHTGARSGVEQVTPLAFQTVLDSFAVFASWAGSSSLPDWYYNLAAQPDALVELGPRTVRVRARVALPAERDVIVSRQKQRVPAFAQYEITAAPRPIPVVVLDPVRY